MKNNDETQTSSDKDETPRSSHLLTSKPPSHLKGLLSLIFIGIIIIVGLVVYVTHDIKPNPYIKEYHELQEEWSILWPTLDKQLFDSSKGRMEQLLKNCEENRKKPERVQTVLSDIKTLLVNLKQTDPLIKKNKTRQEDIEKQIKASENFPDEWRNIQIIENETVSALNQEDFVLARGKLETGIHQLESLEESSKSLKEAVIRQIDDVKRIIRELENNGVEDRMPNEWKNFKAKYLRNDGQELEPEDLYTRGYYRRTKETCEELSRELDRIKTRLAELSATYQKELAKQAEEREKIGQKLEDLHMSLRKIDELNVASHDFFKCRFKRLQQDANTFEETRDRKSSTTMMDDVNKLIQRINKLTTEVNEKLGLQKEAEVEFESFATTMNNLEEVKDLWDDNTQTLWVKCLEIKQEFWQLFEDFDFSAALILCKKQREYVKNTSKELHLKAERKAKELHQKASELVQKVKEDIQPEPNEKLTFDECLRLFNEGTQNIHQGQYSSACQKLNETIDKINVGMRRHFQTGCARLQAQEEWQSLQTLAGQWLLYDQQNQNALKYRDMALWNIDRQKTISSFKEANTKGELDKMKEILGNWRNRMQRNGENPDDDDDLEQSNQFHNKLMGLKESREEKDWQKALNDSIDLQRVNDLGKESKYVMDTIDLCILEIIAKAKTNAIQAVSLEQRHTRWQQVENETANILRRLPENNQAKQARDEALGNLAILQKAKNAKDTYYRTLRTEKQYVALNGSLTDAIANYKNVLQNNELSKGLEDIQNMEDILAQCNTLHRLCNDWEKVKQNHAQANIIRNQILELVDKMTLPDDENCAFVEECKRRTGQSKRTLIIPGGVQMTFISVQPVNGEPFWMGECEVSQGQYDELLLYVKNHLNELKGGDTWFGDKTSDVASFLKNMNSFGKAIDGDLPAHSIGWDEAFAWCEMLNLYPYYQDNPFTEYGYVFRLPKVNEWREACVQVAVPQGYRSETPSSVFSLAPNELGFRGLFDNVSEWSIEAWSKQKVYWLPPQGFSSAKTSSEIKRAVTGGSWKQGQSSDVFAETAGSKTTRPVGGIEKGGTRTGFSKGTTSKYIGFRVVWGAKIRTIK